MLGMSAGQIELLDVSHYSQADLIGSHSDDLESAAVIKAKGKKIDPTWDMTEEERSAFAASYRPAMLKLFAKYPKAVGVAL